MSLPGGIRARIADATVDQIAKLIACVILVKAAEGLQPWRSDILFANSRKTPYVFDEGAPSVSNARNSIMKISVGSGVERDSRRSSRKLRLKDFILSANALSAAPAILEAACSREPVIYGDRTVS